MQLIEDSKNIQSQIEQCLQNVDHTLDALNSCLKNTFRCVIYYNDKLCDYDSVNQMFHQAWKQYKSKDKFLIDKSWEPIKHFIAVSNLPRGAAVEVHVYAMTNRISNVASQKCKISGLIKSLAITFTESIEMEWIIVDNKILLGCIRVREKKVDDILSLLKDLLKKAGNFEIDHITIVRILATQKLAQGNENLLHNLIYALDFQTSHKFVNLPLISILPTTNTESNCFTIELEAYLS